MSGGGVLTLSGANFYTGPTLISGGTVYANNNSALGSNSAVTVAANATLNIPATGNVGLAGTYYNSAPNNPNMVPFNAVTTLEYYAAGFPVITTDRSSNANGQNNGGAVFDYGSSGQGFPSAVLANPNQFIAIWTGQFLRRHRASTPLIPAAMMAACCSSMATRWCSTMRTRASR